MTPAIHPIESEFIGLILQTPVSVNEYADRVPVDAFTNAVTRAVWEAMTSLARAGTQVSIPALRETVRIDVTRFGIPNLPAYLSTAMSGVKGDLSLDDVAEWILNEKANRDALEIAAAIQKAVAEQRTTGEQIALEAADKLNHIATDRRGRIGVSLKDAGSQFIANLEEDRRSSNGIGYSWGLRCLDGKMGPIRDGDFGLIIGPSGHGKSSLIRGLARANADKGPHLLITAEELPEDIGAKDLFAMTGVSSARAYRGELNEAEMESLIDANQNRQASSLYVEYTDDMRVKNIEAICRAFIYQHGTCGMIFVDTIDDVIPEMRCDGDAQKVILACRALDTLSTRLKKPVIGIGQFTTPYNKRIDIKMSLSDTYGGQGVRNKANWGILMQRPEQKIHDVILASDLTPDEEERWRGELRHWQNRAQFIGFKSRRSQPGWREVAMWDGPRTMFYDEGDRPDDMF